MGVGVGLGRRPVGTGAPGAVDQERSGEPLLQVTP